MDQITSHQELFNSATADVIEHELRTPLSYILGYAKLLEEDGLGPLTPEQETAVSSILKGTYNLLSFTEQLTALLAIQSQRIVFQPINLSTVVAKITQQTLVEAERAELDMNIELADSLSPVAGDDYLLSQMVRALLNNALKFTMPGGGIMVSVCEDSTSVCLAVEDTGIGISPNKFTRVFDLFYQIDNSMTRRFGGLGLGLAVAKAVVDFHGGTIRLTSVPDQGSQFLIKLPQSNKLTADTM